MLEFEMSITLVSWSTVAHGAEKLRYVKLPRLQILILFVSQDKLFSVVVPKEGEMIVQAMENSGQHVNVETKTALLKGLSHAGHMRKAEALFASMATAQGE
jgi:pentatricopeptide repeat protein